MVGILGANSVSGGYEVGNSLMFNDPDTPKLTRTNSSGGNRQVFTHSFWFKRATPGNIDVLFQAGTSESTNTGFYTVTIHGGDKLFIGGAATSYRQTNRLFRDPSAWYHIVLAMDTTDGTADNRLKVYVNGLQETSLTTNNTITQNLNTPVNENGKVHQISGNQIANDFFVAGYLAEYNHIDGQQLTPTSFGEFNDNGVWVPIKYTGTYGTNGYFLEFKETGTSQNSSGIGADTSGNDNHFAVTNLGATDVTTDTPTNNFAIMNPLDNYYAGATFSEGNCKIVTGSSPSTFVTSTLGVETGKWYWEVKIIDKAGGSDDTSIGVQGGVSPGATDQIGYNTAGVQLRSNGNKHTNGSNATYMASQDNDDIIMVAFDKTNNNVYFGANGQWGDGSGNTDESNPTSAIGITVSDFVFAALGDMDGSDTCTYEINFGNPSFAISSSNADADGHGNFEYAVPSGYFALCTKNLAKYG